MPDIDKYLNSKPMIEAIGKRILERNRGLLHDLVFDVLNGRIKFTYTKNELGQLDEYGLGARELQKEKDKTLKYQYPGDGGIDLPIVLSKDDKGVKKIWPDERVMLHTGIIMEWPIGFFGRIIHRSSTEKRHRLRIIEGIIDDYRGELLVQVHNGNTCHAEVHHGDRLAQLILLPVCGFKIEYAESLRDSRRGPKGFGSSGT